jgi:16S rRNA (guanine966-N2)-methyltransferase
MRIIAGTLGGRIFNSPGTHKTHPMSDRVRGALFNVLGDLDGLSVLDAFAGSGALGFEAASHGAKQVIMIDSDRLAQKIIEENVISLGVRSKVKLIKASAGAWLTTNPNAMFDVVLCDPPYDNLQQNLLVRIAERIRPDGVCVLSLPPNHTVGLPAPTFELQAVKSYGDATLVFYRRIK